MDTQGQFTSTHRNELTALSVISMLHDTKIHVTQWGTVGIVVFHRTLKTQHTTADTTNSDQTIRFYLYGLHSYLHF